MKKRTRSPLDASGHGTYVQSWKRIASYLNRSVRTCQHWEKNLGLPVYRLDSSPKARVYASREELDKWLEMKLHVDNEAAGPLLEHRTIADRIRSIFRHPRAG